MIEVARRSFITGLIALVAAPAIVRAGSLMPVNTVVWTADDIAELLSRRIDEATRVLQNNLMKSIYGDMAPAGDLAGFVANADHRHAGDRGGVPMYAIRELAVGIPLHG